MEGNLSFVLSERDLINVIQRVLKTSNFTVKEYNTKPASDEASGFMAIHIRVFVCVCVDENDKHFQFFIKSLPKQDHIKTTVSEMSAFKKEIGFYTKIVPEMLSIGISLPYAECYHTRADNINECVVLEDLSKTGYRLTNCRRSGFDFEHCAVTLKALAKLHAASVVLEQCKGQKLNQVYDFLFYTFFNSKSRGSKGEIIFQHQIDILKKLVPLIPQYTNSVKDVQRKLDDLYNQASQLLKPSDSINVVCHGDIWANNILFKYDEQDNDEIPVDTKLVDLQLTIYGPPTIDLLAFFYANTTRNFRDKNLQKLLEIYHDCFSSMLRAFGTSEPGFSLQFLQEDFNKKRIYGLACAVLYHPFCLLTQEAFEERTQSTSSSYFTDEYMRRVCKQFETDEVYRSRLTETVVEYLGRAAETR